MRGKILRQYQRLGQILLHSTSDDGLYAISPFHIHNIHHVETCVSVKALIITYRNNYLAFL